MMIGRKTLIIYENDEQEYDEEDGEISDDDPHASLKRALMNKNLNKESIIEASETDSLEESDISKEVEL